MSSITFDLPASDSELVDQVLEHLDDCDVDPDEMLLSMARKYRFAGYIGSITCLFRRIESLQEEVDALRKKQRWSWF
jgi:hypothetical protein